MKLKIAIIQFSPTWNNPEENLELLEKMLKEMTEKPSVIFLPEMFNTGFNPNAIEIAETMNGFTVRKLLQLALNFNVVLCGTLAIKDNKKYFNRLLWIQPDGKIYYYDKRHLFLLGQENKYFTKGNSIIKIQYSHFTFRLLICYDLRFPVWSRNQYIDGSYEYDVLVYLANWPLSRIQTWKTLLKARAIENLSYVIGVNRTGTDGQLIKYSGSSVIISPYGEEIVSYNTENQAVIYAFLDKTLLDKARTDFPFGCDWDKFDIYF